MAALREVADIIPEPRDPIPLVCRDQKDDYLLAHAVLEHSGYLVSGDKDLRELGEIEGVIIVSSAAFVRILRRRNAEPADQASS